MYERSLSGQVTGLVAGGVRESVNQLLTPARFGFRAANWLGRNAIGVALSPLSAINSSIEAAEEAFRNGESHVPRVVYEATLAIAKDPKNELVLLDQAAVLITSFRAQNRRTRALKPFGADLLLSDRARQEKLTKEFFEPYKQAIDTLQSAGVDRDDAQEIVGKVMSAGLAPEEPEY